MKQHIAIVNLVGSRYSRGAEIFSYNLANSLNKSIFKVHYLAWDNPVNDLPKVDCKYITIYSPKNDLALRCLAKISKLPISRWLKSRGICIIDIYEQLFSSIQVLLLTRRYKSTIFFLITAPWIQIPLLLVKHTSFKQIKIVTRGSAGISIVDNIQLLLRPDAHFFLSKYAYRHYLNKFPSLRNKMHVAPNTIEANRDLGVSIDKCLSPSTLKLVLIAADVPYKRLSLLLDLAKYGNHSLHVYGRSTSGTFQSLASALQLSEACTINTCDSDKVQANISKYDVFILLSQPYQEAFGLAYLEAVASFLPIVCTDDPIRREILGDYPVYYSEDDSISALHQKAILAYRRHIHEYSTIAMHREEILLRYSPDTIFPYYNKVLSSL